MGRKLARPPKPFGRFVAAMRIHARTRAQRISEPFRKALAHMPRELRREDVAELAGLAQHEAGERQDDVPVTPEDIANLEKGRSNLSYEKNYWLLRGLLFNANEAREILTNDNFIRGVDASAIGNGHLIPAKFADLFIGEYGPAISNNTFRVGDEFLTTWLEVDKASEGGFKPQELHLIITEDIVSAPPAFEKLVDRLESDWQQRRSAGKHVPFNNPTLALDAVISDKDDQERNLLTLRFKTSKYSRNAVAKGPHGSNFRWHALQELTYPPRPTPFLASGVGVAICVFCDGGQSVVIGQRSHLENFRQEEFDIAVVEGIRPNADVNERNEIDLFGVLDRALDEELGTGNLERLFGRTLAEVVTKKAIFEFGCDLKYYQWNFLAAVTLDLGFDEVLRLWQSAKDRRENQRLIAIENNSENVLNFVRENNIWSCGVACLLRSLQI